MMEKNIPATGLSRPRDKNIPATGLSRPRDKNIPATGLSRPHTHHSQHLGVYFVGIVVLSLLTVHAYFSYNLSTLMPSLDLTSSVIQPSTVASAARLAEQLAAARAPTFAASWGHQGQRRFPAFRDAYTCVELLAVDRAFLAAQAARSRNFPKSRCDVKILHKRSVAHTWRRGTWAKIDVIFENERLLLEYDYVLVRDIDTKVNTTHVLGLLERDPTKAFAIGYIEYPEDSTACHEYTAVTNWFAFKAEDTLVRRWVKSRRKQTDQHIFNVKFRPCCMSSVLCIDKCEPYVNEVHCRKKGKQMKSYDISTQDTCIESQIEPNPLFYAPNGEYRCPGRRSLLS